MRGFGAYAGLGVDVPFRVGDVTSIGHPMADNTGTCNSSFAIQQMLADLGYSPGKIDGQIGSNTFKALASFATATGTPYTPGSFPRAPMCQALMNAWSTRKIEPTSQQRISLSPSFMASLFSKTPAPVTKPSIMVSSGTPTAMVTGASWWSGLSQTSKIVVIGGGVAVVGIVVFMATRKKKAVANRRRAIARKN